MPATNDYKPTLIKLMSFVHNAEYDKHHVFSQDELASLTPVDVQRWMCLQAYGTPDPLPDANPYEARSSSLEYWKKAISSFIPNRLMVWNAVIGQGNPTRSIEVNDLIKKVKKKDVRGRGLLQKHDVQ